MKFDSKNIPEKTKLIHAVPYKKIFGSATEMNLKSENIKDFIENLGWKMVNTCVKDGGVGLAAPQISIPKKVIIMKEFINPQLWDFTDVYNLYINPKCIPIRDSGEWVMEESCLSVPNSNYEISRFNKVNASYYKFNDNNELEFIEEILEGYEARVFMHETDHLNNISIVERYNQQQDKIKKNKITLSKEETIKQERDSFFKTSKSFLRV